MSLPGPLVAIVGPTASGKSALAEAIACELRTSVVSVDAMQVYRGMDIGTAKVPAKDRRCPLLMVDVADVGDDYSVKLYQHDARQVVDELLAQGKTPILCGGTGLYLNAIVDDMQFPAGDASSATRKAYEEFLAREGEAALYRLLEERDPKSAELIHPHNTRRVVRALEMLDEGSSYATHHEGLGRLEPRYDVRIWGIDVERATLYDRINRRVDDMFAQGLVDEVAELRSKGLGQSRTASQAIGYKEVLDALEGRMSMDEARDVIKMRTRRYAKRQLSWFRHDKRVRWIAVTDMDACAAHIVLDLLAPNPLGGDC
ncbi:MAG: tRNA (adenosine(37)-N6)-dimethylallyltransferase MiaA [Atopobiaceae bacterium]|nr:tRNA (adenosine(37)-N6)-dimethylallyltransferase MiaA [Atopobiaceae bacterium]